MKSLSFFLAAFLAALALDSSAVQSRAIWTVTDPGDVLENGGTRNLANIGDRGAIDAMGNRFVLATDQPFNGARCMVVLKLAVDDGHVLWRRDICGADDFGTTLSFGGGLALDASNHLYVTGMMASGRIVSRLSPDTGETVWEYRTPRPASSFDAGLSVEIDQSGDAYVVGKVSSGVFVARYAAATGALVWERDLVPGFGGSTLFARATSTGGQTVVAFWRTTNAQDATQNFLSSVDAAGTVVWEVPTTGSAFASLAFDSPTTFVAAFNSEVSRRDAATGAALWTQPLGGTVRASPSGRTFLATSVFVNGGLNQVRVVAYGAAGTILWDRTIDNGGTQESLGAFTLDDNGNPVVLTSSSPSRLLKLSGHDGTTVWIDADTTGNTLWSMDADRHGVYVTASQCCATPNVRASRHVEVLPKAPVDMNADATTDLVFENADGRTALWLMDDWRRVDGRDLLPAGTGWHAVQSGDFNGDGKTDLIWMHDDGRVAMWLMDGATQVGGGSLIGAGTGWTVKKVGDFNGDGKADLLWQHSDGRTAIWLMNGASQVGGALLLPAATGWSVTALADFNADGKADIAWQHADGRAAIWTMDGTTQTGGAALLGAGTGWAVQLAQDFNGDGKADLVWLQADGRLALWTMDGARQAGGQMLAAAGNRQVLLGGDFDGDGRRDVLTRVDGNLTWVLLNASGAAPSIVTGSTIAADAVTLPANLDDDYAFEAVVALADGTTTIMKVDGSTAGNTLQGPGTGWRLVRLDR